MSLSMILNIAQITVAILLILTVLLQERGTGLGSAFGGESNVFRARRGPEKFLFISTIVLAVLFGTIAILNLFY